MLHITAIMVLVLFFLILRRKKKSQIHYVFLCTLAFQSIWCISVIIGGYLTDVGTRAVYITELFAYIGACFLPVALLFLGIIYAHTKIRIQYKHAALLIVPIISLIVLWTNDFH